MARRRRAPGPRAPAPSTHASDSTTPERHVALGLVNLALGATLLAAVWGALPARWWPGDLAGTGVGTLWLVAGALLVSGRPHARVVGRVAAGVVLAVGLVVCTAIAWTAAYLAGLYGPVGGGGAIILGVVAALLLPYLVLLPAAELWLLAPGARR